MPPHGSAEATAAGGEGGVATAHTRGTLQRRGLAHALAVLEGADPGLAREFARTTAAALRGFRADGAWSGGLLNGTGAPLEFSCATFSDELRYTVELSGPEVPPAARLRRAGALLDELGGARGAGEAIGDLAALQHGGTLSWGAWLGIRHCERGTSFKLYGEVSAQSSEAAAGLAAEYLGFVPAVAGGAGELVLVGRAPGSPRCELYYQLPGGPLSAAEVDGLLAPVGLADRGSELRELAGSFHFRRGGGDEGAFPKAQWGMSYSVLPGAREPAFSLFAFAQDLMGGDGLVRRQVLAATRARGWGTGPYAALSEPLANRPFRSGYHNMIAFMVAKAPMSGIQVSFSPPPQELHDD